jgi:hypothetical protein
MYSDSLTSSENHRTNLQTFGKTFSWSDQGVIVAFCLVQFRKITQVILFLVANEAPQIRKSIPPNTNLRHNSCSFSMRHYTLSDGRLSNITLKGKEKGI